jgi:hypothetical protein
MESLTAHALEFTEDPAEFLAATAAHLAADPVVTTVIATVTERIRAADARGLERGSHPCWWVVVRDDRGEICGVAMRTAPFRPHPVYVLPMPHGAAVEDARRGDARGGGVTGVNGALPAARAVAEETARLTGRKVRVHEHLRLFELGELDVPPAPPGRLRLAVEADAELCLAWYHAFAMAAAEQAGRSEPHDNAAETFTIAEILDRIADEVIWLWEDEHRAPVHLTGANLPANNVVRIGPVYTPVEHRGHRFASRAVAEVSQLFVEQGVRCCLFTDQENPTSNAIYQRLGYRPVVDMVNLLVE